MTIVPGVTTERETLAALLAGEVVTVPEAPWCRDDVGMARDYRLGERHLETMTIGTWRRADPSDMTRLMRPWMQRSP